MRVRACVGVCRYICTHLLVCMRVRIKFNIPLYARAVVGVVGVVGVVRVRGEGEGEGMGVPPALISVSMMAATMPHRAVLSIISGFDV